MQDLENDEWIILDPLENVYEIYTNLTVTALLNVNHVYITQAELCLKSTIVEATVMFVTISF